MFRRSVLAVCILLSALSISAQQTVGLFVNESGSMNGYTLFTVAQRTYLIDNCGRVVNEWSHNASPGLAAYLTEEGTLLRCDRVSGAFSGGGLGGRITEQSWDGELLWTFDYANEDVHQHHDIELMPNGNVILIAWEKKTAEETAAMGAQSSTVYSPTQIIEVTPTGESGGEVVWEWHVWDHLIQDVSDTLPNYGVVADHPERVDINAYPPTGAFSSGDWIHCNSVSYNEVRDELVLGSRDFGEVWVIDHSTTSEEAAGSTGGARGKGGDLLYRWGNPQAYGRGSLADQVLFGQHNVLWVPGGHPHAGAFSLFNNGVGLGGPGYSSALIFQPPLDEEGDYVIAQEAAIGPEAPIWTYEAEDPLTLYSQNQGGAQPLTNGNLLINSTTQGEMREVDLDGDIVWRYGMPVANGVPLTQGEQWNPPNGTTFKAIRYSPDFAGFEGRDLTPGVPIELNPIDGGCEIYLGLEGEDEPMQGVGLFASSDRMVVVENSRPTPITVGLYDLHGRLLTHIVVDAGRHEVDMGSSVQGVILYRALDHESGESVGGRLMIIDRP